MSDRTTAEEHHRSVILRTATQYITPLLLLYSVFLLLRGHDEPGGGFVGGLMASAAFVLHAIAYGVASARRLFLIHPPVLIGAGLLLAAGSAALSLLAGKPFMTGTWGAVHLGDTAVHLGTPVFFDIAVYLVVLGVTVVIILSLAEE